MTSTAGTTAPSVVITGAGGGLGREMALQLDAQHYRVMGTALSQAEVDALRSATDGRVTLTVTDISDDAAVGAFARSVTESLGDRGLDLLISNAGILTPGPMEVVPLDAVRRELAVNVFGSLAVINALLPALRTARGRIVQVSSMTAFFPLPFNGPSSASKAALEAFADVYRAELHTSGVDFVMAIPGNMRTGGPAKTAALLQRVADGLTPDQREVYGKPFGAFADVMNTAQSSGLDAVAAAARVLELAQQTPAPIRGAVGADAEQALQMVREHSDADLDLMRLQLIGLAADDGRLSNPMTVHAQ
jgi:NAD(P)-dependent dehydrogenase (short-subunit alcohol dehydrogenase family)